MTKPFTEKQRKTQQRNWVIFRLKGMAANLLNLTVVYPSLTESLDMAIAEIEGLIVQIKEIKA